MLKAENLTLYVNDNGERKCLLNDISFQVEDGEMLVITGPNGGGKSTLAKALMGIEKMESGRIVLNGEDITEYDINHRAKAGIGYAFQQPPRFKGMPVQRLLSIAAGKELSVKASSKLLADVGLCAKDYIDRQVDGTLSGGEMKRIEIASVLAKEHSLCIFDEPEAGIDLWSFNSLIKVFEKMRDEINGTILIISHQERILDIADKIIVIADGQVRKVGTKEEVLPELLNTAQTCQTLIDKA